MKKLSPALDFQIESNGVATLTLNRAEQHNAFSTPMIQSILAVLDDLFHQPQIKVLVIKSSGKTFSAGADLNAMHEMAQYSQKENELDAKQLAEMMYRLAHFNKPTLAVVQGPAFGGGVGLIACCQMAIASTDATFCFSEVKLGIIPAIISPYIIRILGPRRTLAYFLSCRPFDAHTAQIMGLCHEVVSPDKLDETAHLWIHSLLQGGPNAIKEATRLVNEFMPPVSYDSVEKSAQLIAKLRVSPEGQEGLSAFLENRKPNWMI